MPQFSKMHAFTILALKIYRHNAHSTLNGKLKRNQGIISGKKSRKSPIFPHHVFLLSPILNSQFSILKAAFLLLLLLLCSCCCCCWFCCCCCCFFGVSVVGCAIGVYADIDGVVVYLFVDFNFFIVVMGFSIVNILGAVDCGDGIERCVVVVLVVVTRYY